MLWQHGPMALHRLREIWSEGGTAVGAWVMLRDPLIAEVASRTGYDWVCIDLQHGLAGFEELPDRKSTRLNSSHT